MGGDLFLYLIERVKKYKMVEILAKKNEQVMEILVHICDVGRVMTPQTTAFATFKCLYVLDHCR